MSESSIYFVSAFATTAFGVTNTFLFGVMNLPASQIAHWGVSYTLIGAIQSLYSPIVSSLYPHVAARRDFRLVKKIVISMVPANAICVLLLFLLSDFVILVFSGSDYLDAVPIFKWLLPVLVFSFPAMIIGFPFLGIADKISKLTVTTIISAVFHLFGLMFLILIDEFNVLNVAILRSSTEFVLLVSRVYMAMQLRRRMQKVHG